jgi:hypothetical protein
MIVLDLAGCLLLRVVFRNFFRNRCWDRLLMLFHSFCSPHCNVGLGEIISVDTIW